MQVKMARRKIVEVDELIWLIHEELLARIGKGKTFSFAISSDNRNGWTVCTPVGGRKFHPAVRIALREIERDFQVIYSIPVE